MTEILLQAVLFMVLVDLTLAAIILKRRAFPITENVHVKINREKEWDPGFVARAREVERIIKKIKGPQKRRKP